MRLSERGVLLLVLTATPVVGWSQQTSLAPSSLRQAGVPSTTVDNDPRSAEKETKLRRFKEAIARLGSTSRMPEIKRNMEVLRDGFPDSRPVLVAAAKRSTARVRALAIKLLGDHGNVEDDLDVVAGGLADEASSVRMAAVMALRRLGKDGAPAILGHLPREREPNIRKMAVTNLKAWGDPDAIPPLARSLRTERDRGVRKHTVRALRSLSGRIYGDDTDAWIACAEEYLFQKNEKRILDYTRSLSKEKKSKEKKTRSRKRKK